MSDQIILHIDMDCFYVSCERLRDPDLIDQPVIVGMNYIPGESRGAVATASYEARALGIESAMNISKVLSILPDTELNPSSEPSCYYRSADKNFYREISQSVRDLLENFSDVTRHVSIDEAYLDVTNKTTWNSSVKFSQSLGILLIPLGPFVISVVFFKINLIISAIPMVAIAR